MKHPFLMGKKLKLTTVTNNFSSTLIPILVNSQTQSQSVLLQKTKQNKPKTTKQTKKKKKKKKGKKPEIESIT